MKFINGEYRFERTPYGFEGRCKGETLRLTCLSGGAVRVQATRNPIFSGKDWSLTARPVEPESAELTDGGALLAHGGLIVQVSRMGRLRFLDSSRAPLLEEILRLKPYQTEARSYRSVGSDTWKCEVRFLPRPEERIFGMGQFQDGIIDRKGTVIDLIQRNTTIIVPFHYSTTGYAFLWNNPSVGRVEFAKNGTRWSAEACRDVDYCVAAAPEPKAALRAYAELTGYPSAFPAFASGFWQSRLRYETQEEALAVVREHKARKLPLSVFVIDFFHWSRMGDWRFDERSWPDPEAMVKEIREAGAEVMVSIFPTVNPDSENFEELQRKNLLLRTRRGAEAPHVFTDTDTEGFKGLHYYDPFNPEARRFIWETAKRNYFDKGIKVFWLDSCEPEIMPRYDPENVLTYEGIAAEHTCAYPFLHEKGFYEGMRAAGVEAPLNLCRSAWAGSQRYGAAVWSGDVVGTFESFRLQVAAGLSFALCGIPWWTTDIGGFFASPTDSPEFRELLVRWFQFGVFSPICRLHGFRDPVDWKTGGPNEVWSFGEEVYGILKDLLFLRERLRPYVERNMVLASETGLTFLRPLFVDYPADPGTYDLTDQYLLGEELLVAPVLEMGQREREVYLPAGSDFVHVHTGERYRTEAGAGRRVVVPAPLDSIPVFVRRDSPLLEVFGT